MAKEIVADENLIAFCGLYCGACGSYLKGRCPGCMKNEKATWCKTRKCNMENQYRSCADCKLVGDANDCKKFHNIFSKIFGLLFRSDRKACVELIKKSGYPAYAEEMASKKLQLIKR